MYSVSGNKSVKIGLTRALFSYALYRSISTQFAIILGFDLVSLFNGISTLFRLFNAKAILLEEQ